MERENRWICGSERNSNRHGVHEVCELECVAAFLASDEGEIDFLNLWFDQSVHGGLLHLPPQFFFSFLDL